MVDAGRRAMDDRQLEGLVLAGFVPEVHAEGRLPVRLGREQPQVARGLGRTLGRDEAADVRGRLIPAPISRPRTPTTPRRFPGSTTGSSWAARRRSRLRSSLISTTWM